MLYLSHLRKQARITIATKAIGKMDKTDTPAVYKLKTNTPRKAIKVAEKKSAENSPRNNLSTLNLKLPLARIKLFPRVRGIIIVNEVFMKTVTGISMLLDKRRIPHGRTNPAKDIKPIWRIRRKEKHDLTI